MAAIHESAEMYLETILILSRKNPLIRSIDVCEYMGYSKPSVSRAMGLLKKNSYIIMDAGGHIALTEAGRDIAVKIYERHNILSDFLIRLGVDEKIATEDACRMEHVISDESFAALKKYIANDMS